MVGIGGTWWVSEGGASGRWVGQQGREELQGMGEKARDGWCCGGADRLIERSNWGKQSD